MTEQKTLAPWLSDIWETVSLNGGTGHFVVVSPIYRPDLFSILAGVFGVAFADFRKEKMQPLGTGASRLGLEVLDQFLDEQGRERGVICHNAEALLATKSAAERENWLSGFLSVTEGPPVIVPMVLFGAELPDEHTRIAAIREDLIPEETLLMRLMTTSQA